MDTFKLTRANIIVPGAWNSRIFNPMWLIKNFDLESHPNFNKKIGLGFNFEERDVKFDFCGISLTPTINNLTFQINDFHQFEDKCNFTETILKKIILLLPHTPIKGIGFNFVFKILSNTPSYFAKEILSKSEINSEFILKRNDYQKKEGDYILTVIGLVDNDDLDILGLIEFNFNYESPNYINGDNVFYNHYNDSMRLINGL